MFWRSAIQAFFSGPGFRIVLEPKYAQSNYWLNPMKCPNHEVREALNNYTNAKDVMPRPILQLMHHLPMFRQTKRGPLAVSEWIESCLVNIPSSPCGNIHE